jgi:hypothetical protein
LSGSKYSSTKHGSGKLSPSWSLWTGDLPWMSNQRNSFTSHLHLRVFDMCYRESPSTQNDKLFLISMSSLSLSTINLLHLQVPWEEGYVKLTLCLGMGCCRHSSQIACNLSKARSVYWLWCPATFHQ